MKIDYLLQKELGAAVIGALEVMSFYSEVAVAELWTSRNFELPEITKLSSLKLAWPCLCSLECSPIHKQSHSPLLHWQHRPCFCIVQETDAVESINCPLPKQKFLCHHKVPLEQADSYNRGSVKWKNYQLLQVKSRYNLVLKISAYRRCFLVACNSCLLTEMPERFKNFSLVNCL